MYRGVAYLIDARTCENSLQLINLTVLSFGGPLEICFLYLNGQVFTLYVGQQKLVEGCQSP